MASLLQVSTITFKKNNSNKKPNVDTGCFESIVNPLHNITPSKIKEITSVLYVTAINKRN
jgi:hypothetical protein